MMSLFIHTPAAFFAKSDGPRYVTEEMVEKEREKARKTGDGADPKKGKKV
jgi:hypothetical protein